MRVSRLIGLALLILPLASAAAEPIRITGRVWTDRDEPLPGARLELFFAYEGYDEALHRLTGKGGPATVASARTNAEGAFEMLAPESGCFRMTVQADGYLSEEIAFLPLVEDVELPYTSLWKASSAEVRTVGPDGRPLAGIEIRAVESDPWMRRLQDRLASEWQPRDPHGITDATGRVALPWFRLYGPPTVAAISPRFLGQTGTSSTPEEAVTLRLSPARSGWIEARGADGKPVPGALARWNGWPVGVTGPDGRLEIAVPEGESALILESREGWGARVVRSEEKGILPVRLEPRRRITGRVVDPQNRPLAGAVVWSDWPLVAPAVRSDATGAFLIEIPAGEESWLQAVAAGFLPGDRRLIAQSAGKPMILTLAPAATLSGIVVDRTGQSVAGAQIVLHRMLGTRAAPLRVSSGSDGRFRLTGLPLDGTFRLTATRTGFARTEATARTAAAGKPSPFTRIVMEDGQTAFGRVVDDGGRPIAGAEVKLLTQVYAPLATASDAEGRFEFRHLSPGRISILATHPGFASGSLDQVELPPKTPAVDLGTLRLPPGEVIEGRVTDSRGAPIEGADVAAFQAERPSMVFLNVSGIREPTRTQSDGTFRIEGLEGGKRFSLTIQHAGYVDVSLPGVLAPTEEPLRIEMKPARALSGQVVGPQGEPVANASLTWVQETRIGGGSSSSSRTLGTTDADGKFRVSGLPQGPVDLEVTADGYADRRLEGLQIPAEKDLEDLRITLQRAIVLDVTVLSAKGEPVPDLWVHAEPMEQRGLESLEFSRRFRHGPPDRTDLAGRCRLTLPAPGNYRVSASEQGFPVEAQVTAGSAGASVELRFPPGVEVSGRVVGEDGAAISGASVNLQQNGGAQRGVGTLADGTFLLSEVPDGDYQLTAVQEGLTSDALDVAVSGNPIRGLELRLDRQLPGATLTGHILGLPAEDLRQLQVRAFGKTIVEPARLDREGAYRFEKLAPGEWHVTAMLPEGRSTSGAVEIPPDATAVELDLNFSSGLTLTGRVTVDGAPLIGAQVQAWGRERISSGAETAYDGSFTLRDLAAGPMTLIIIGSQGLGGTRTLPMTENQEISIALTTGRLSGRVSTVTGEPAEDATVRADAWIPELKTAFSAPGARTGEDGRFEIPRIVAGTYKLTILQEGFAPAEVTVVVPAGGEKTVEILLKPGSAP